MGAATSACRGAYILARRLLSEDAPTLILSNVQVSYPISLDSRAEYHRVTLRPTAAKDGRGPSLVAHSTGGQRSSRTVSLAHANGLLELPARSDAQSSVAKGELVDCLLIGEMASAL